MPVSWNETRSRALAFSKEWADESSEDAEAKAFWGAFFAVFGVTGRRVASFEEPVKNSDGAGGLTKNGKSPGSAGGLEKFDISGSPSGNFKP